ncbi:MAG TPA: hypothetical protein VLV86_10125 [Vicinamibacterales bacterium]|nr:hypothetical protein [Vicinamibacterales bacterium]
MPDSTQRLSAAGAAAVSLVLLAIFVGPIGRWSWDHDEVQTLMEIGVVPLQQYPGPVAQMERMPRLIPVWTFVQRTALRVLPVNEWGTRVVPATMGALIVLASLLAGFYWRGRWFAWSILVLMGGSSTLVWLAQQNRFYSLALLCATLAFLCAAIDRAGLVYDVCAAVCAAAATLSHNLTLVIFVLAGGAGVVAWFAQWISARAARRLLIAGATSSLIYLIYLRPLVTGWLSGGTGGTAPLVSFVAQTGIVPIALAVLGCWMALTDRSEGWLRWWSVVLVLDLVFVATAPWTLKNWNPRYALFFMPPVWVLAAAGSAFVAESVRPKLRVMWLVAVAVLLLPKFGSHFIDGSRHDFRSAAQIIARTAPTAPVVSDWPADLQYYLQPMTGQTARYWEGRVTETPLVVVLGTNAWEPPLSIPGRHVQLLGQTSRRRFDEQSHVVRVYLVDRP